MALNPATIPEKQNHIIFSHLNLIIYQEIQIQVKTEMAEQSTYRGISPQKQMAKPINQMKIEMAEQRMSLYKNKKTNPKPDQIARQRDFMLTVNISVLLVNDIHRFYKSSIPSQYWSVMLKQHYSKCHYLLKSLLAIIQELMLVAWYSFYCNGYTQIVTLNLHSQR
jgi:hypothetical protein